MRGVTEMKFPVTGYGHKGSIGADAGNYWLYSLRISRVLQVYKGQALHPRGTGSTNRVSAFFFFFDKTKNNNCKVSSDEDCEKQISNHLCG